MSCDYPDPALLIGGEWIRESGAYADIVNPATGDAVAGFPLASVQHLDAALSAAAEGFEHWRALLPVQRGEIMHGAADRLRRRCEAIATILTIEQGKPLDEAKGEILSAAAILDWSAEEGRRGYGRVIPGIVDGVHHFTLHAPVGPVAAFTPWNFPALTPARKIGAALAAGCSIVLKPSEETPGTAIEIARAFQDAGLPRGVLNLVFGDPSEISEHLIASPVIRKVTFTGSTAVGRRLMELSGRHLKPSTMELGGHAPVIVCEDADPDAIVEPLAAGKFRNAGQVCIAPTRFFVHSSISARFVQRFAAKAESLVLGDGLDPASTMGPLANQRRIEAVEGLVADLVDRGATINAGGRRAGNTGFFYRPTVVTDVDPAARIMAEEPFGPVVPILSFDDEEEAIAQANALDYGLAAYAFTGSARRSLDLAHRIRAGMVGINSLAVSHPETPFGGVGDSGHGQEGGIEGVRSYLDSKLVAQG
ncbi:MAG: NAD-dependent succinate-semialdehyde dehydrogenase [Parasphingopyxis sp.]|uniref:NAD-dependent succinate-semialdehyde dehydrogenase n=1 Tax=Parasphingopyxis sp. TaxID=1920299 RepID=UPI003FA00CEB